jgi:signal transduction histidine kinase
MPDTDAPSTAKMSNFLSGILDRQRLGAGSVEKDAAPASNGPRKLRILIVEDERIVARDLQIRLTNLGYIVTEVASSKDSALASARRNRPDLALMDIRLNGVPEGIAAARELRADFNLPVIYLTGHSDTATLTEARMTEPFGYILKPFENRELVAAIETAVYKHKAETRLRDANNRLRLAQRAGRVGVFDWNGETGEFYVTAELEELHQAAPGSIRTIDDLWGHAGSNGTGFLREKVEEWIKSDRDDESWEYYVPVDHGAARWVQVRAKAYRDVEGRPIRIIGTEVDITERKEMEDALLAKEKELERSNADLQAYAYTIAHDLQEPVRTLVCGIELIERDFAEKSNSSQSRLLFHVKNSGERLRSMIAGLLEYSRVAHDDEPASRSRSAEALATVVNSLKTLIDETGAKIEAGGLPEVELSEDRVAQLFQNLISNSLKFRRNGVTPHVKISAERQGRYWRFVVADNGIGFDSVYAERIFGVFKRLHSREVEGTGIGLSVCKRIVERAGGAIHAESVVSEGSKFIFTLPAATKSRP